MKLSFQIPVAPGQIVERFVYAYIVFGRERIALVDCGVAGSEAAIFAEIAQAGRRPEAIDLLVLTHAHPDHLGAAAAIRAATGCLVAAHAAERAWIEDVDRQARERPVPGFATLVGGSVPVDQCLADGDALDLAGLPATVLHVPGHSAGSLALWLPSEGALIAGDAVPRVGDLPIYDDAPATARSLERLWRLSGLDTLLASWDEPRAGAAAYHALEEGLQYVCCLHETVRKVNKAGAVEPLELCRRVFAEIGLAPAAANPLAARTMLAHLAAKEQELA